MRGDRKLSGAWARKREDPRGAARGFVFTLACALALAVLSGSLLSNQIASAASRASFSSFSMNAATATTTDTPAATATDTPAATATDTPAATATDTPIATATDTPTMTPTSGPTATPTTPPNPYALDISAAITEAGWPQQGSNWCGVATVAAIADYINPSSHVSQQGVINALNNPANASEWGYPTQSGWGPYVPTDIARDFGTDPRSLAEGLTLATGIQYHVIVDTNGAWNTTIHIVDDLLTTKQPISVFVDHGQHSVVVSGVDATGDPLKNPNSITAIHVWDPGGGINGIGIQSQMEQTIPIKTWLSGIISWSGSDYFKYPYAANMYQGMPLDPDPAVGPYAYKAAKYNHMWVGHYVYLSPVAQAASVSLSADWELTPSGALYVGYATSAYPAAPPGYAGPTVPMPTNAPPPPPPVRPPKPRPPLPPAPTPTPRPKPTATPIPTATPLPPTPTPMPTDPPKPVCAPVSCALAALSVAPAPLALALLLLFMLGLFLMAPLLLPSLIMRRSRSAPSDAQDAQSVAAPLTPAPPFAPDEQASAPNDGDSAMAADAESATIAEMESAAEEVTGDNAAEMERDAPATDAEGDAPASTVSATPDAESDPAPDGEDDDTPASDDAPLD